MINGKKRLKILAFDIFSYILTVIILAGVIWFFYLSAETLVEVLPYIHGFFFCVFALIYCTIMFLKTRRNYWDDNGIYTIGLNSKNDVFCSWYEITKVEASKYCVLLFTKERQYTPSFDKMPRNIPKSSVAYSFDAIHLPEIQKYLEKYCPNIEIDRYPAWAI